MCWSKQLNLWRNPEFIMVVFFICTFLLTSGPKHPMSGIQKPRSNFLQSAIQKAPQALRPTAARCAAASSASADNPQVPAGTKATV